ncbi:MAG: sigma-70 family RNA polymerase sigma factor [Clostridiales bacterium]|nr:sigma-70 family RNA polymerase sigma factor [Clostridiales bacterium]
MISLPYVIAVMPEGENKDYMTWLYEQHYRLMYSIAWEYSKDRATVEDIVSDSVVALLQKIETLRPMERNKLSAYIVTTVRNTALNHCDKQQRINSHVIHTDIEVMSRVPDRQDIEKKIVLDEELDIVWEAISRLPEKEMLVMKMKFSLDLPDDVIADEVGLSVNSIPKYISRAREHIKEIIYA